MLRLVARLRNRLRPGRVELVGPKFLARFADAHPDATFVEVGAHDGARWDQIQAFVLERSWSGVMVEPVPNLCDEIRRNYAGLDSVAVENAAISDSNATRPFYQLKPVADPERDGLPDWYDAIGSLDRDQVMKHRDLIPDLEDRLVTVDVACMTFESLCEKHRLALIDFLMVDTEGHDWTIVRGIDFDAHRPRLVVYEHQHLNEHDRAACRSHLERHGYETKEEWWDTWCLHSSVDERLKKEWRRLNWQVRGVSDREPREATLDAWRPGSKGRPRHNPAP